MKFKRADEQDYLGILALQQQNQLSNLNAEQLKQGFLSVAFTKAQFKAMNKEMPLIVCKENNRVIGYLCSSSLDFNQDFALPAAMLALFPKLSFDCKLLSQYQAAVVGPWCVDKQYRGKGVFEGLWHALDESLPKHINLVATFISTKNPRSLSAAQKVGMAEVTTFDVAKQLFWLLAKAYV